MRKRRQTRARAGGTRRRRPEGPGRRASAAVLRERVLDGARAQLADAADEQVQARLLRFDGGVLQPRDEQLHAVLLQHAPRELGRRARRARERRRRRAPELLVARARHDGHQAGERLLAHKLGAPLPAVAHNVLDGFHGVVLRDLVLARAQRAAHRAHRGRRDLPRRSRRRRGGGGASRVVLRAFFSRSSRAAFSVARLVRVPASPPGLRGFVLLRGDVEEQLAERRGRAAAHALVRVLEALREHRHHPRRGELLGDVGGVPQQQAHDRSQADAQRRRLGRAEHAHEQRHEAGVYQHVRGGGVAAQRLEVRERVHLLVDGRRVRHAAVDAREEFLEIGLVQAEHLGNRQRLEGQRGRVEVRLRRHLDAPIQHDGLHLRVARVVRQRGKKRVERLELAAAAD